MESFYDKIVNFTGWNEVFSYANKIEKSTKLYTKYIDVSQGSLFVVTIMDLISKYYNVQQDE